jgi:Zn-dependent protease with chaperone function
MFAARGIAVSSSVFFLIYVVLSLAVRSIWPKLAMSGYDHKLSAKHCADLLFALRMFPFAAAAALTAAFTVPSFLLFEPRAIEEPVGGLLLALAVCGIGLAAFGAANAFSALIRASRMISRWMRQAETVASQVSVPVLRIDRVAPALTAAGILRSRVLLSATAESVLHENELRVALQHEVAHVRRRDNLKKLCLRFVAFPGMGSLEAAWRDCTEMAADDAAVATAGEALDLAAALIKLSKISASPGNGLERRSEELMTAFVPASAALMKARIARLIQWSENRPVPAREYSARHAVAVALATTITMTAASALTYSQLLAQVHAATEWLVR